jgi:multicomponent K+:H+ antiporter subunit E
MRRITGGAISPVLVLALVVAWLLLNQTLDPAQIVLGAVLATVLAWAASTLRPLHARVKRLDVAALLMLTVFLDIARSNWNVARIVLGIAARREIRSGFVDIPLDLRDPHGLAALAVIVTSTPGTVWAGLSPADNTLTLHVLDLQDEAEWVHVIKHRYERPLMRIFE